MRKILLLSVFIIVSMFITAQKSTVPAPVEPVNDELKKKLFPEFVIKGYEENTLLVCIKPELNSVESFNQIEEVLASYIKLANVSITRVLKPEKTVQTKDNYFKTELKDKDIAELSKPEKSFMHSIKLK